MHHFVATSAWDAQEIIRTARAYALEEFEHHGGVQAWVLDDTSYPKKGSHSVGVGRQYCGVLGKQENCQVAVTLSIANHAASLPVAWRLYLPEAWAADPERAPRRGCPRRSASPPSPRSRWRIPWEAARPRSPPAGASR